MLRRWAGWILGVALAVGLLAAVTDNSGRSRSWPPMLAAVLAAVFFAQVVDAYRNGSAQTKFGSFDRVREPKYFYTAVLGYGGFGLVFAFLAGALWFDLFR